LHSGSCYLGSRKLKEQLLGCVHGGPGAGHVFSTCALEA
jgi:hypothetical protein